MRHNIFYLTLSLLILVPAEVAAQDYSKMSPTLRKKVHEMETSNLSMRALGNASAAATEKDFFALIKVDGDLVEDDCISHRGNIHIVCMPLSKMAELSTDSRVIRIESEPSNITLANDSARAVTRTNMLHNGEGELSQAYDGTGILIGVLDLCFDYNHPTFLSKKDNRLRIQRVWDMLDGIDSQTYQSGSAFPIGKLLKPEEIVAKDHSTDSRLDYHGTHVAGTAAGSGYDSPYGGMAPEADIYMVNGIFDENYKLVPEDMRELCKFTTLQLLAFSSIFNYADSIGKPCVINFSGGANVEMTENNTLYCEYLSSMLGPGRILVAAAGNDGMKGHIMYKTAAQESVGGILSRTRYGAPIYLRISSDKPLSFKITDISKPEAEGSYIITPEYETTTFNEIACLDDLRIETRCYKDGYNSDKIGYDLSIEECWKGISKEEYSITISGTDAEARIHIQNGKLEGSVPGGNVLFPGELQGVISVGATTWREELTDLSGYTENSYLGTGGKRAEFSSCGPALSGKTKPDVVAPGANIISAYNRTFQESHADNQMGLIAKSTYNNHDYYWKRTEGTSMATPAVAGIVALWLQAKPDLTPEEVIDVLAHTSRHYDPSLTYPNNEYGYGEIDAYKGLLYILHLTDIEGLSTEHVTNAKVRPMANGDVSISIPDSDSPTQVRIYNTNGQCMMQAVIPSHTPDYTISNFGKKGIFAVQVGNYGSTLIRIE